MIFIEKIKEVYSEYKEYILFSFCFIVFLLLDAALFYYFSDNVNKLKKELREKPVVEVRNEKKDESTDKQFIVDIKGEVKTPGVYILDKGRRVIDVVNKAGGFTKNADSYANNLSMKIKDEMVIVIYSKEQIKDYL